jgi:hypothetical protein
MDGDFSTEEWIKKMTLKWSLYCVRPIFLAFGVCGAVSVAAQSTPTMTARGVAMVDKS